MFFRYCKIYLIATFLSLLSGFCFSYPTQAITSDPLLSMAGIEQLIRTQQITSIEQLLPHLPVSYRSRYVLAFHSRSLQSASYLNPRVIFFGNNAKFMLTFNGSSDQVGFNALELAEFNDLTKTFSYQEILFPTQLTTTPDKDALQVHFSVKNPDKCLACHGTQVRPIWDSPPLWPGMYGEHYREQLSAKEVAGLSGFLAQQANHPRYQFLAQLDIWRNSDTFSPSHAAIYSAHETESPNAQLTQLLSRLNVERIIHQVTDDVQFNAFSYALLASVSNGCSSLNDYFPRTWNPDFQQQYQRFSTADEQNLARELTRKKSRDSISKSVGGSIAKDSSLVDFRFIAELGLRIDTSEWSMQLEKNAADFSAIDAIQSKLEQRLLSKISATDKELINVYYYHSYPGKNKYCAYLEKRSVQNLAQQNMQLLPVWSDKPSGVNTVATVDDAATIPARVHDLLSICAGCHTTGVAPFIPFNNAALLSEKLKQAYSARGTLQREIMYRLSVQAAEHRMPPNMNLTQEDQTLLEHYFQQ